MINKSEILFIAAGSGYYYEGVKEENYQILNPYIEHNFGERLVRELCFRLPFLPRKIWYNKKIRKLCPKYIIVSDPLITREFLLWLQQIFPFAQLNFIYGNMVGKAKHLKPDMIPEGWRVWTFDEYDSLKYGLRLNNVSYYFRNYVKPKEETLYDVVFVGADKGRGEFLLQLEAKLKAIGLKTKFVIVAVGRFDKKKTYYQKRLSYSQITDLIVKSRAILNVGLENQKGITVRDMESLFFNVKLLTTNKNIENTDMYHSNNVFVIDGLNIDGLNTFMSLPHVSIPDEIKNRHTFYRYVEGIVTAP